MTQATYNGLLNLAAGAFLLAAVLIVWRRELQATVKLLAWQGLAWPRSRSPKASTRMTAP